MDTHEQDLLRQIAQVAGAINRHSRSQEQQASSSAAVSPTPASSSSISSSSQRFNQRRSRHSTAPRPGSHHKTLVLHGHGVQGSYVSARQRSRITLTHAPCFAQAAQQTIATSREARRKKLLERLLLQEAKEAVQLRKLEQTTLVHEGITYRLGKRAHLLIRQTPMDQGGPTPLETTINGVLFLKSPKSNNLFRKTTVKLHARRRTNNKTLTKRCTHFTRRGFCSRVGCQGRHTPGEVAVCPFYLRGTCTKDDCTQSHSPNAHNTPQCTRFAAGGCTVEACRFVHEEMQQQPDAAVCMGFDKLGWCDAGVACHQRHVLRKQTRKQISALQDTASDQEDAESSESESDVLDEEDFDEDAFQQDFVHL
ncbi:hypothetical protein BCR37DRAFT_316943 [Protomyces lactucae-debilis]|uniref:C3H1-type domain-containing protein n=1 Tax=Protomyces lactucae-debilis TaxID=2754530 RepID=A0A1Y2FF97_PROLT|nr:uncharacterized protein BCR37DRAFT_316943 [Protomyces lactucae-debilis]ORY82618.1 hypothetical protein BCR37DRAFT_316943 [Protomyces lactucae-debilis]